MDKKLLESLCADGGPITRKDGDGPLRWTGRFALMENWHHSLGRAVTGARKGDGITRCNYLGDASAMSADLLLEVFLYLKEQAARDVKHVFSTCQPLEFLAKVAPFSQAAWPEHMGLEISVRTVRQAQTAVLALRAFNCELKILRLQPWRGDLRLDTPLDLSGISRVILGGHIGPGSTDEMCEQLAKQVPTVAHHCGKHGLRCDFRTAGGHSATMALARRNAAAHCLEGMPR
jgi:hypothetical protein